MPTIPTTRVKTTNAAGSAISYGARFGGAGATGKSIAVDAAGNAYVAGSTDTGANFTTTTADAFQRTTGGNGEGFLAILNSTASAVTYATLFGGDGNDSANAVALDATGNVYVAGNAQKNGTTKVFPTTTGAFQTAYGGNSDAFVVKLNGSVTPTLRPASSTAPLC